MSENMSEQPPSRSAKPSFSPANRWAIGFDVVLRTLLVLAVVAMVNFLAARFFHRFFLSPQTRITLAPRTVSVVHALTNQVTVTLFYDRKDDFYPSLTALLNEYQLLNPKITVHTVDYVRNPGEAELVKAKFNLTAATDKNAVIFSLPDGTHKVVPGDLLTAYKTELAKNSGTNLSNLEFVKKPVAFLGENAFTAALLALESSHQLKTYFLQGHGEASLTNDSETSPSGLLKFGQELGQNNLRVANLYLASEPEVPADCNLLIIAGPQAGLYPAELEKIGRYLQEGGRLLLLFNAYSVNRPTGLEPILQRWGVQVLDDVAKDAEHTVNQYDIFVNQYGRHPMVAPLTQFSLQLYSPRPVEKINWANPPADAPSVDELFFTSPTATLTVDRTTPPRSYSLACAIEQKTVVGGAGRRGSGRIVVVGDDIFLANHYIEGGEGGANRDFLDAALNWLLEQPQLVDGIGPHPVTEFRLQITTAQQRQLRWLLLGALPGGALLLGWLVWFARRK